MPRECMPNTVRARVELAKVDCQFQLLRWNHGEDTRSQCWRHCSIQWKLSTNARLNGQYEPVLQILAMLLPIWRDPIRSVPDEDVGCCWQNTTSQTREGGRVVVQRLDLLQDRTRNDTRITEANRSHPERHVPCRTASWVLHGSPIP